MSFLKLLCEELKALFAFRSIPLVVFGGSLLYLFLYPTPYINDTVRQQQIAIIDMDNTTYSKDLIFLVASSPYLKVKYVLGDNHRAHDLLQQEEIMGVLMIPDGFESNLYRGIPTPLNLEANAAYFLIYGSVIENLNEVINALSDTVRLNKIHWQGNKSQNDSSNLVQLDAIPLYNPSVGYINYALAAILVFILHQTSILGTMMLGAHQNSLNHQGEFGYWNQYPIIEVIIARLIVFGGCYVILFLIFFGPAFEYYGVHVQAYWVDFWCFALTFIICCISLGVLLGFLLDHPNLPTQIILISSMPIVFMMGFIWPVTLLPKFLQFFINLIPAYHGISGFLKLNQMGASLSAIMPHFYALILLSAAFILAAYFIAQKKFSRYH